MLVKLTMTALTQSRASALALGVNKKRRAHMCTHTLAGKSLVYGVGGRGRRGPSRLTNVVLWIAIPCSRCSASTRCESLNRDPSRLRLSIG